MNILDAIQKLFPPPLRRTDLEEFIDNEASPEQLKRIFQKMGDVIYARHEVVAPIFSWVKKALRAIGDRPAKILVLATGHGALELALAEMAEKEGRQVEIIGVDISEIALEVANTRKNGQQNIRFKKGNAQALPIGDKEVDLVLSNNLIHHLDNPMGIEKVLREAMRVSQYGFYMLDPLRCQWGEWVVGQITKRQDPDICHEAVKSYQRAYIPSELEGLVKSIDPNIQVASQMPWFLSISYEKLLGKEVRSKRMFFNLFHFVPIGTK